MLILTRRAGETIRIGSDVKIQVIEVKGGQVRIGIEAPPGVPILRAEIEGRPVKPGSRGDRAGLRVVE